MSEQHRHSFGVNINKYTSAYGPVRLESSTFYILCESYELWKIKIFHIIAQEKLEQIYFITSLTKLKKKIGGTFVFLRVKYDGEDKNCRSDFVSKL